MTDRALIRRDVLEMVKWRVQQAELPHSTCSHTFRAIGIKSYLENGGTIENAQAIATHESTRTTKLYDRASDEINLSSLERISSSAQPGAGNLKRKMSLPCSSQR